MAKTKISEFSTTAGNNTDINSINIAEGCAPSGINDAIRELMRQLKEFQTGGAGDSVNSGGDFSVATNKFTVASASGNTAVAGTLAVTGTTTLTGALVANGNATLGDGSGDTVTVKGTPTLEVNPTLSGGTANGVLYLNGSKVATSGSALTFDGTNFATTGKIGAGGSPGTYTQIWSSGNVMAADGSQIGFLASSSGAPANYMTGSNTSNYLAWIANNSEAMRLTSTGLGIGTSSPSRKLTVVSGSSGVTIASAAGALFENSSHQYIYSVTPANYQNAFLFGGGSDNDAGLIWEDGTRGNVFNSNINVGAGYWTWTHGATENMRLDSSGNLGLGVTPSAWNTIKAFEIGGVGNFFGGFSGDTSSYMGAGAYYNTGWKYAVSSKAVSKFEAQQGSFTWSIAPSGTAGNAITFTQAMTLDASGNLGIGTTSAIAKLDVRGKGYFETTANPTNALVVQLTNQTTTSNNGCRLSFDAYNIGSASLGIPSDSASLAFYTNGNTTERARIDSSGQFQVGTIVSQSGVTILPSFSEAGASGIDIKHVSGSASGDYYLTFQYANSLIGSITQSGTTAVLYNVTSDQRLKENIVDAPEFGSVIDSIKVRSYDWKADGNHQRAGFVAQELVTVAPEAVHQPADPEAMMAVDYSKLVPMLVKEIQSLRKRLADAGIA